VFGLAHANAGADRLAADLGGFRATRPDAHLNVVAHSYGSTTASITLHDHADLGVNSFVTLGSAGIPVHIPNAGAIHAEHMYAAQAEERFNVAHIGQVLSYPERIDPTFKPFGATEIDASHVEGTSDVNVHDLYVNPNDAEDADHGYLDLDTNTLIETAKATLR
jgi:pimeloyl-ACP methyl ester carboxylesterase